MLCNPVLALPVAGGLPTKPVRDTVDNAAQLPGVATDRLGAGASSVRELAQWPDTPSVASLNKPIKRVDIVNVHGAAVLREVEIAPRVRIIEHEWLLWHRAGAQVDQLLAQIAIEGIRVVESAPLPSLGVVATRIRITETDAEVDAAAVLRARFGEQLLRLERNYIYEAQVDDTIYDAQVDDTIYEAQTTQASLGAPFLGAPLCQRRVAVGVVDTAFDAQHPYFTDVDVEQMSFVDTDLHQPLAHGTAVLSRLVSAVPQGQFFHAGVFYRRDSHSQGATTYALLKGLNWLASRSVKVINMSLAGPPDAMLDLALQALQQQGIIVVAAVGNDGPAAAPLYPAAYAHTLGVTAIDAHDQIYRWALQGEQVAVAAPGVRVRVARVNGEIAKESGTSLAAPSVSGWLACEAEAIQDVVNLLKRNVQDLGEPGRDNVFGFGKLPLDSFF